MPEGEGPRALTHRDTATLWLLAVGAVNATIGGFLIDPAAGFLAIAVCCLIVAVLLGWQP